MDAVLEIRDSIIVSDSIIVLYESLATSNLLYKLVRFQLLDNCRVPICKPNIKSSVMEPKSDLSG